MSNPYEGDSSIANTAGIKGTNTATGLVLPGEVSYVGVWGKSTGGRGILGEGITGVEGSSATGTGVGVRGTCNGAGAGVLGTSSGGDGVHGESQSNAHAGVSGINNSGGMGVFGSSSHLDGVQGWSQSHANAGVSARNTAGGYGVWAQATTAGYFDGDVKVTGDVLLVNQAGSDCAEDFDVVDDPDATCPGNVMVIGDDGKLAVCAEAYDSRVAGVISGAGGYRPAIVLQRIDSGRPRATIALGGKVYCKVDATLGPIGAGDLLTTSPTRGHAMKVLDKSRALGAIVGKALASIIDGRAMIPIMVSLR
jgi:hypothetical protein